MARVRLPLCALLLALCAGLAQTADAGKTLTLLDPKALPLDRLKPSSDEVTVAASADAAAPGLIINAAVGKDSWPGVSLKPEGKVFDLSAYGHLEAKVANLGTRNTVIALRVDNEGDWQANPWSCEQAWLKPGESAVIKVIFGHSYGQKATYPIRTNAVNNILMFSQKTDAPQVLRVEYIIAGGPAGEKPPVDPKSLRTEPVKGFLFGGGVGLDPAKQLELKGGATAKVDKAGLAIALPAAKGEQWVAIKPELYRWDLRRACEVRVVVLNSGTKPLTPSAQVFSDPGPTDPAVAAKPLAPGAQTDLVIPFMPAVPVKIKPIAADGKAPGLEPNTGTRFISDAASAVRISATHEGDAALTVVSVKALATPMALPAWVGTRPPVAGDWVPTLNDNFDGTAINAKTWNIYGPNYWDKVSHWSKDNLIVKDGLVRLRQTRQTGHHNDDPKEKESPYAGGYLDTYGKWVQRYGYFEARLKAPTAPGMWPAVWMMPDRGANVGEQWQRADTGNGGMEFDIWEHLTRWGPYRYNIAMHWDGYGDKHKSSGSPVVYVAPDKDGFIAAGLLWLPGQAVYYANGVEVLRWEDPRVSSVPENFIIDMVHGGWDNNSVDDKQLPCDFPLDYIRVWQRRDLASAVDGYQPQPKPAPKAP